MSSCDKQSNAFQTSVKTPPFYLVQCLNEGNTYSKSNVLGMRIFFFFLFLKISSVSRVHLPNKKTACGQYSLTKKKSRKRRSSVIILREKVSLYPYI